MKTKSAGLAAVFSFLIPGLGQVYNGEFAKAFVFILAAIIGGLLSSVWIGYFIAVPVWAWSVLDAYNSAEAINRMNSRRRGHGKNERWTTEPA